MAIEIKAPVLPESVSEGTVAKWYKKLGEFVARDEHLLDIETDKVVLEIVAPAEGSLETILKKTGDVVNSEEVVALLKEGKPPATKATKEPEKTKEQKEPTTASKVDTPLSPAARRALAEKTTEKSAKQASENASPPSELELVFEGERAEKRVPMSRLRSRIAERLVEAQHTAAILTTFNEINMHPVMELRQKYKEAFEKTHGVRLGLMSFFTIAVLEALKRFPIVNASIDNQDIIYHGYYDIGIAVSSPRGLVVPVIRNAETLTMAEIEKQIAHFSEKAKTGQLSIEELTGGTFTISNGGVFGSLMSTPILNPPQSAILGMHKIEERPIVEKGEIVIRPMMYVALSYDHRIIDGAESVRFLLTIKEVLEEPARMCLGV